MNEDKDDKRLAFADLYMEEPEIFNITEPEEDYNIQLYKPRKLNAEEDSLAAIYNGAFRLAQKNPFFKKRFIAMINDNLKKAYEDSKAFDDNGFVEPKYRLYKHENDEFTYYLDIKLPNVSQPNEIDLCLSDDKIVVACLYKKTLLNLLLPVAINYRAATNFFDKLRKELRLKIPILRLNT